MKELIELNNLKLKLELDRNLYPVKSYQAVTDFKRYSTIADQKAQRYTELTDRLASEVSKSQLKTERPHQQSN